MSDSDLRIYIRHIRSAGFCASGAREWFKAYGFSWDDMLSNGIAAADLLKTGDALAQQVVDRATAETRSTQ